MMVTLGAHFDKMTNDLMNKYRQPHNFFLKELIRYNVTATDRRFQRNIDYQRGAIRKMIRDRKAGKTKTYKEGMDDLLSILIDTELYADKEENIIDDVLMLFLAGS